MGDYTGLRCKVVIKPEYREEFEYLHNELQYEWSESNIDFLREYGEYSRATFIPCGCLSYMPDEWEDTPLGSDGKPDWRNSTATDGFEGSFDRESGLWTFQCSLKNYDRTIQYFFENVLNKVAETTVHLEYYFEYSRRSTFYELINGQIVESKREGIEYKQ
ncbi:MAG: hypothetical protein ACQEXX_01670 [Bacillota bacterium]